MILLYSIPMYYNALNLFNLKVGDILKPSPKMVNQGTHSSIIARIQELPRIKFFNCYIFLSIL